MICGVSEIIKYRRGRLSYEEAWKNYHFGGLNYKVSNLGRVIGSASGRMLATRINNDGYEMVTMGKDYCRTGLRVHRLVADLFIENPNNYEEVNHIDFNRTNNRFDNLEWTTHSENIRHTVKSGRHAARDGKYKGENNPNYGNKKLSKFYDKNPEIAKEKQGRKGSVNGRATPIALYDLNKNQIKKFDYIGECAEYLKKIKLTTANINSIRSNITQSIKNNKPYLKHYYKRI